MKLIKKAQIIYIDRINTDYVMRPICHSAGAARGHKKIKNKIAKIKNVEPLRGDF
ncbi:MAG: hypothetical protein JW947_04660 [Sedimentisphaerales bacterium]|nr:hypothetical protein [Sedimentisphaerales bacterium]